jgi:hypothetical protein
MIKTIIKIAPKSPEGNFGDYNLGDFHSFALDWLRLMCFPEGGFGGFTPKSPKGDFGDCGFDDCTVAKSPLQGRFREVNNIYRTINSYKQKQKK